MDARLEQIFRDEARHALGAERMTAERLMRAIAEFPLTATPEEAAIFAQFVKGLASGLGEAATPPVPMAPPVAQIPLPVPPPGAQRFRVPYPAPARPRAVPTTDDIEDFTATGS